MAVKTSDCCIQIWRSKSWERPFGPKLGGADGWLHQANHVIRRRFHSHRNIQGLENQSNKQRTPNKQHSPFQPFVTCIYETAGTARTLTSRDRKLKSCKQKHDYFHVPDTPKATRVPAVSRRSRCECEYSRRDGDLLLAVNHHQRRPDRLSPQVMAVTWGKLPHVGVLSERDRTWRWSCTCRCSSVAIKVKAHGG